jgi:magnesium transporter
VSAGFILSSQRLITIRFEPSRIFENFAAALARHQIPVQESSHFFVGILEAVVDRRADVWKAFVVNSKSCRIGFLEWACIQRAGEKWKITSCARLLVGSDGWGMSYRMFARPRWGQRGLFRLLSIWRSGLPVDLRERLETLRQDIASVSDYDTHLNDKLQFMLDATLGFINMAQNDVMKVLTIASVAGIPPVLIAGIYGMNFKVMPELTWALGYPNALALIVITTVIPLIVFKVVVGFSEMFAGVTEGDERAGRTRGQSYRPCDIHALSASNRVVTC